MRALKKKLHQLSLLKLNYIMGVSWGRHDLHKGRPELFAFVLEEIRNNLVGIRVNPLAKNKYVEEKKTIVEEQHPKVAFRFGRVLNSFLQNSLGQLKRCFLPSKKSLCRSGQFGENMIIKIGDAIECLHCDDRHFIRVFNRFVMKQ